MYPDLAIAVTPIDQTQAPRQYEARARVSVFVEWYLRAIRPLADLGPPRQGQARGVLCMLYLEELMFWYSSVGADRPPKQAMPVARQEEDLGLCVLWSLSLSLQSVPRCKKMTLYV